MCNAKLWDDLNSNCRAVHSAGAEGATAPARKTERFFFSNIVFDFAGLFLVAILVRNLYTGYPCEGVLSLPPQIKNPTCRYGPDLLCLSFLIPKANPRNH